MNGFCKEFSNGMAGWAVDYARWFLLAALIVAILSALLGIAEKIIALKATKETGVNPAPGEVNASSILAAITALIGALTNAPAWFALFLAGLALLWVGPAAVSQSCPPAPVKPVIGAVTSPVAAPAPKASATPAPTRAGR